MSSPSARAPNWLANVRPCLKNGVRTYKAARLLQAYAMYPEAGTQLHRTVEAVMEAAVARAGVPILDRYTAGPKPTKYKGEHDEKRKKFHDHWLNPGGTRSLPPEEAREASRIIAQFSTQNRNALLYVNYFTAREPSLEEAQLHLMLEDVLRLYRIVRPHLEPIR